MHLSCTLSPVKPNTVGEQVSGKMGARYHCVICSATIIRRTDMLGAMRIEMKSECIAVSSVLTEKY